jgi:hypothetical protein
MSGHRLERGYRNGKVEREVTTENGFATLQIPRPRIGKKKDKTAEFRSERRSRYQR